jgi:hypothetical protein
MIRSLLPAYCTPNEAPDSSGEYVPLCDGKAWEFSRSCGGRCQGRRRRVRRIEPAEGVQRPDRAPIRRIGRNRGDRNDGLIKLRASSSSDGLTEARGPMVEVRPPDNAHRLLILPGWMVTTRSPSGSDVSTGNEGADGGFSLLRAACGPSGPPVVPDSLFHIVLPGLSRLSMYRGIVRGLRYSYRFPA